MFLSFLKCSKFIDNAAVKIPRGNEGPRDEGEFQNDNLEIQSVSSVKARPESIGKAEMFPKPWSGCQETNYLGKSTSCLSE